MALRFSVVFLYVLGTHAKMLVPTIPSVPNENYGTIRGYRNAPRCDYESCQSSNSCQIIAPQTKIPFSEGSRNMPCFCDRNCLVYGDCCFDYFETCLNVSETPGFQTVADIFDQSLETMLKQQKMLELKRCRDVTVDGVVFNYWMISVCPNTTYVTEDDFLNCEITNRTVIGRIPVTLVDNPSLTFANYYCAQCHGLKRRHIRFWQSRLSCVSINLNNLSFTDISEHIMSGNCKFSLKLNADDIPRICRKHINSVPTLIQNSMVSNLNSSFSTLPSILKNTLCFMYSYPVVDPQSVTYKNPHCALEILGQKVLQTPLRCDLEQNYAKEYPPYRSLTPWPTGHNPFPGATPYQGPTPWPIGYTPSPGATPYQGPTLWPIGYTPSPGATPYFAPTLRPTMYVPFLSAAQMFTEHSSVAGAGGGGGLNILFNFGENDFSFNVNGRDVRESKICPREDEVYITYNKRCGKLECDDLDRRPVNGTCRLKEKVLINGTGQLYPKGASMFVVSFQVQLMKQKFVEKQIRLYFGRQLKDRFINETIEGVKLTLMRLKQHHIHFDCLNTSNENTTHDRIRSYEYTLTFYTNISVSSFINGTLKSYELFYRKMKHNNLTITRFELRNFKSILNITKYTEYLQKTKVHACPDSASPNLYLGVDLVSVHNKYYAKIKRMYYGIDSVIFQIILEKRQNPPTSANIMVCETGNINDTFYCPNGKVTLRPSEYRLGNNSLILIPSEVVLSSQNFTRTSKGVIICNIFSREIDNFFFFDYNYIQKVLTITTSSVSIVSLVLVLIIYCCLSELRNVPGKIVMCLSLTLLLAQMFQLLITTLTGWLCTAVASLVHMTWLSTFMWMTMLSVDLTRSLRSMSPIAGVHSYTRLLFLYAVLAWLLPIVFVAVCVLVDHFNVMGVVIGYGSDHLCWISSHMASLYIFGLPVAMTLLINVICFFLTLISIEQTIKKMSRKSKSFKNEKTRLGIYIRLMSIMGFTWIFCFAAAYIRLPLLWYFQIILNGLQGFYIFLCFVCKSRILKLFAEKYRLSILKSRFEEKSTHTSISGV